MSLPNPVTLPVLDVQALSRQHEPTGELVNKPVPNANEFYPLTEPAIGTALPASVFEKNKTLPKLFQPLKIRDLTIKNRIWVSPMCQYSSPNGLTTDWHLVHIGSFATRGAGLICMEASGVTPEGRITPEDNGIWSDEHIPGLKRIVDFVHSQGGVIGIQLAHAGRKASTRAPWVQADIKGRTRVKDPNAPGQDIAAVDEGGWPDDVLAPSAIAFSPAYPQPKELTKEGIDRLLDAFEAATLRAKTAGFDFVEIHGAHGYLLHTFVSPLSNKRTDDYGGSLDNRLRFPLEVAKRVRKAWGEEKPVFYRLSGTDWAEGPEKDESGEWKQWGVEQSTALTRLLTTGPDAPIDLVDVSSGGLWSGQKIPIGPSYQVPLAEPVKKALPNTLITSVGLITHAKQAEEIVSERGLDAVWLARELLRDIDFPLKAAEELGIVARPAVQYERAWTRMFKE